MIDSSHHRTAGAALVAALFMIPTVHAQPRDAGIAGGSSKRPTAAACNIGTPRWSPKQNRCVIRRVFPRRLWTQAYRIAHCESRFDEHAISRTGDYGLFQINRRAHPDAFHTRRMLDPVHNTQYARRLQAREGWQPWTCSRILGIR